MDDLQSSRIAIPGWSSGVPDFESNTKLTPSEKTGSSGYPKWYDEIMQQWPRAAARYGEGLAEVATMGIALAPCGSSEEQPDGDETPEEAAWNDAFADLLKSRCGLSRGDGIVYGAGEILSLAYEAIWYGFSLAEPYWHEAGADPMRDGRLVLVPLLRAAIYRWAPDYQTGQCSSVWYMASMGTQQLPYSELVHLAHRSMPGQYYGHGELRPLIGPFAAWRMLMTTGAQAIGAATGRLVVKEPDGLDGVAKSRLRELNAGFDSGRVRSFSLPAGAEYDIHTAGGSIPDIGTSLAAYDAMVDQLFSSRTSSLGITSAGSRATAEVLSDEDSASQAAAWDGMVNRLVQRIGGWVASQTGYRGRIRQGETERYQADQSPKEIVPLLVQSRDLLGGWSPSDADLMRERLGWQSLEAAGLAAPQSPAITVDDVPGASQTTGLIASLSEGCDCGACRSASLSEPVRWAGRDGVVMDRPREPLSVEVDGVVYRPELAVAWSDIDAIREEVDATLGAILLPIIEEHRAATWDALESDGYVQAEQDRIYADYRARYEAAILDYYQQARDAALEQAQAERAASDVRPTERAGLDPDALRQWTDRQAESARLRARISAETIASRVQTPVQSAYAAGTPRSRFTPRQTIAGLASEAGPIATRVEAIGSLVDSAEAAPPGQVVIAAVRTAVRDGRACVWCASQDGTAWRFPEQTDAFLTYMDRHSLPDQDCEGGDKCRCRITLIWGRKS